MKRIDRYMSSETGLYIYDKTIATEINAHSQLQIHRRRIRINTPFYFSNFRFVVSMAYYGVLLNVVNLGGDFYLNLLLLTLMEYPAKTLALVLLDRVGRKKVYIAYMLLGGAMCVGTKYPVEQKNECKYCV